MDGRASPAAIPGIAHRFLHGSIWSIPKKPTICAPETNIHRIRANGLQEEQNKSAAQMAELQGKIVNLTKELDTERNKHIQQIAANTQRPQSRS